MYICVTTHNPCVIDADATDNVSSFGSIESLEFYELNKTPAYTEAKLLDHSTGAWIPCSARNSNQPCVNSWIWYLNWWNAYNDIGALMTLQNVKIKWI